MGGNIFTRKNFILLAVSVALLAIGYLCLGQGPVYNPISWSVAPFILVITYCVLIPFAIIAHDKGEKNRREKENSGV